jgi:AbrB family looped-hinge helix DNA binding protein
MKTVVSEKGQVTIPKALRRRLGIVPGTVIEFSASRGRLVGEKDAAAEDPVAAVTGVAGSGGDVDAYLERVRGPAG